MNTRAEDRAPNENRRTHTPDGEREALPSNSPMQLTATFAARGVLCPPRLLSMAAADWHVSRAKEVPAE